MPKKPPRNSFYYFMLDFKEEQRKNGIMYENMAAVATAAGEPWKTTPQSVRAKYEAKAKAAKQKFGGGDRKYTSQGIPFSQIEQQQKELKDLEEAERQDVMALVKSNIYGSQNVLNRDFYIMDVNYYCKVGDHHLIGECTLLRFNLEQGIIDTYHEIINPGEIPIGYASDVKLGSEEYGLDMPDTTEKTKRSDYMQILATIIDYLKQQNRKLNTLPPIFSLPEKVEAVYDFILQMCNRAAEDISLFRIYKLDYFFFALINSIKQKEGDGFPKESLAQLALRKDSFKYTPKLACPHHEPSTNEDAPDKSLECTMSRTKRWALTILDSCCPIVGIAMEPGKHLPFDFDTEGIDIYKEQKRGRMGPSVAGAARASQYSSFSMSVTNDSLDISNVSTDSTVRPKRQESPMRMPKSNYVTDVNAAPDLDDDFNFPALNIGRGRGRQPK